MMRLPKRWWLLGVLVVLFAVALLAAKMIPSDHQHATASGAYTLTITPDVIHTGDSVVFAGVMPQAAFRQARNPQFHSNPYGYVFCDGGWQDTAYFIKGAKTDGGFVGTSYPLLISAAVGSCQITTGYWTETKGVVEWNQVSYLAFSIT